MINYGDADEEANVLVHPTTVGGFAAVATRLIRKGEEVGPSLKEVRHSSSTLQSAPPCVLLFSGRLQPLSAMCLS